MANSALPGGVTVDAAGDVWVADWGNQRIHRFTSTGDWLATWGQPGSGDGALRNPNDVAVDDLGRVYVVSDFNNQLHAFTRRRTSSWPPSGALAATRESSMTRSALPSGPTASSMSAISNGVQAFHLVLP